MEEEQVARESTGKSLKDAIGRLGTGDGDANGGDEDKGLANEMEECWWALCAGERFDCDATATLGSDGENVALECRDESKLGLH